MTVKLIAPRAPPPGSQDPIRAWAEGPINAWDPPVVTGGSVGSGRAVVRAREPRLLGRLGLADVADDVADGGLDLVVGVAGQHGRDEDGGDEQDAHVLGCGLALRVAGAAGELAQRGVHLDVCVDALVAEGVLAGGDEIGKGGGGPRETERS